MVRVSAEDVSAFARASGDVNPLHVDDDFARRSPYGATIVHGVLVVVAALAAVPADRLATCGGLNARFLRPVRAGLDYEVDVVEGASGAVEVSVREGYVAVLAIDLMPGDPFGDAVAPVSRELPAVPEATVIADVRAGETEAGPYAIASLPDLREIADRLGAAAVPDALLGGLAWGSWFVGMRRPGRDALFGKIRIRTDPSIVRDGDPGYDTVLKIADPETGTVVTDAVCAGPGAGLRVRLQAFYRPAVPVPTMASATGLLAASNDLAKESVLVVGGSRGIGAALTAVLAAQGATVWAAHRPGGSVARLRDEFGADRIRPLVMDAEDEAGVRAAVEELARAGVTFSGIVLSAGPAVFSASVHPDSVVPARAFVDRSLAMAMNPLAAALPLVRPDGWLAVMSSSTVEDLVDEWPHYTIAKSAVEALARHCAQQQGLRTLIARAPRMWTDMSNGPMGRFEAVPTEQVASAIVAWVGGGGLGGSVTVLSSADLAGWSPPKSGPAR